MLTGSSPATQPLPPQAATCPLGTHRPPSTFPLSSLWGVTGTPTSAFHPRLTPSLLGRLGQAGLGPRTSPSSQGGKNTSAGGCCQARMPAAAQKSGQGWGGCSWAWSGAVGALKEAAYWSLWSTPPAEPYVSGRDKDKLMRARPTSTRKKPGGRSHGVYWGVRPTRSPNLGQHRSPRTCCAVLSSFYMH